MSEEHRGDPATLSNPNELPLLRLFRDRLYRNIKKRFLLRGFRPYRAVNGGYDRAAIDAVCAQVSESLSGLGLNNPFSLYQQVVDFFAHRNRYIVRPLRDLKEPLPPHYASVCFRHDLDGDIVTGIRAACYLARQGVPGSFYVLHTSGYYGYLDNGTFVRNVAMESYIADLVATGCEIGLHTDPLYLFCKHDINGCSAVKEEIAWLRSLDANVCGSVAHNSAHLFGAENFEIFRGRSWGGRHGFECDGKRVPLQIIDEKSLGLRYEGNYPIQSDDFDTEVAAEFLSFLPDDGIRSPAWQKNYFMENPMFRRGYDMDIWLLGTDAWMVADYRTGKMMWPVTTETMLGYLDEEEPGYRAVISIHPEYVSK